MNTIFKSRWSALTTPLLVVAVVVFGLALSTQAADATRDNDGDHKINICHATSADANPYNTQSVDKNSTAGGHDDHDGGVYPSDPWGDIIPPYSYQTWEVTGSHMDCPTNNNAYGNWAPGKTCSKWFGLFNKKYAYPITVDDYGWVSHDYPGKNWTAEGQLIYQNDCDIPEPTIQAQKVICDTEEYLPNGNIAKPVTDQTAANYVAQSNGHCWLAQDWDFQWWWGNASKHDFSVSSPATIPTNKGTIKVKEVLPSDYLGFSNDNQDNYTAEFYCANDVKGYDNEEWISNVTAGMTYQCVGFNVEKTYCGDGVLQTTNDYNETEECDGTDGIEGNQTCSQSCEILEPATVNAQKVICKNESDLPNSGSDRYLSPIDEDTAQDWVDQSAGNCWLAEWDFQIAPGNTANVDNNSGEAGAPWTTFSGSTEVAAYTDKVWLREIWDEDYIPFSGDTTEPRDDVSAEFYCNNDVLNYDNYDWITNLQPGQDYYCVGWNVMKTGTVTFYKDVRWNNDKVDIDDNQAFGVDIDGYGNVGNVSENNPLTIELPIGNYSAEEVLPAGYEGLVKTADFEVVWSQEKPEGTDVYFENKLSCSEGATWAYGVEEYTPGAGSIAANRLDPLAALGPADGNAPGTFVSLGQGGTLTVKFEHSVIDGAGDDISIHETTNGNWPEETALVEVSYDGNTWYTLGTASNHNPNAESYFDLASVSLPIANYVRLTDTTDVSLHDANTDGFDVDAIDATYGVCEDLTPSYIQGKKFADADYSGTKNNGDYFMDGWTINLYDSSWNLVKSMGTGDDSTEAGNVALGQYRFTNLYPDTYYICEVQQDGWLESKPEGSYDNLSGNSDEAPYCFRTKITKNGQAKTGLQFGNYQIMCGDGYIHGDEACDDGQMNGQPGYCSAQCDGPTLFCGDQTVTPELGEQCDGNTQACVTDDGYNGIQSCYMGSRDSQSSDTQISCTWIESCDPIESCGDEIVNGNEQCDDGNITSGDGCSQSCTLEETHFSIVKSVLVNGEESLTAEGGDILTYTITVQNTGETNESNLYIEDTTPTNTTLVPNWGGDLGDPVDNLDGSFTWGPFSLGAGESVSVTFDVTVNAGLPIGVTNIENQATLYQAPEEENLEATNFLQKLFGIRQATAAEATWKIIDHSNIVLTTVTIAAPETPGVVLGEEALPGLSVEKTVGSAFTNPGGTVTYTVTVTNNGDAVAENVTIIDTLPDGLHFTDTVAMDHSWVIGDILDGESASISYDVIVDKDAVAGNYINTVVAWAADVDNVTDTATLEVRAPQVLGAETLPVTGAGVATLVISTLAGLGAVALQNRKRQ